MIIPGTTVQDDIDEETNDIEVEEARIDADAVQLPEEELRSLLCETLMKVLSRSKLMTLLKKSTRLKKGINFWARVTEVRPKHRGN